MSQSQSSWNPARTWVFVVGALEWKHDDIFSPFPQQNRRDATLVELFRRRGVPQTQIFYLQDQQATTKRIQQAFEAHLSGAVPGDMLVLYYCGHGGRNDDGSAYFASYDTDCDRNTGWLVDTIPDTIERCFGGTRALLLADCCCSGSLADAVARAPRRLGYASLASSLANELSTGNWTFTEGLVAGLAGLAFVDGNSDKQITLQELAGQIIDSMAFAEEQIATFATTGDFAPHLVLATARTRPDPRVGWRGEVRSGDDWYMAQIVDAKGDQLKAHFYGYEEDEDEWVTADDMREVKRTTYPAGTRVEVRWKKKWYAAQVLEAHVGIHHIQYDDYGLEWNEWVSQVRIRLPG